MALPGSENLPLQESRLLSACIAASVPEFLDFLPAHTIGRLHLTSQANRDSANSLRERTLSRRGYHPSWSWQKAHAVEAALFCDPLGDPCVWTKGPNAKNDLGNVMESERNHTNSYHFIAFHSFL